MRKQTIQLALVAGLVMGGATFASAQGVFDDGAADSNWSSAANWDNDALPSATDNVQIGTESFSGVTATYDLGTSTINDLRIGNGAGSAGATGTLDMNAGSLTTNGWAFVGSDANAANTNPTAGTFNLGGTASLISTQRLYAGLGGGAGATGTGMINVAGSASIVTEIGIFGANDGNAGVVNQTGGTVSSNSWMTIGEDSGAQGTYNLSGGSLTAGTDLTIGQNSAGTSGVFNMTGGSATVNVDMFVGRGQDFNGEDPAEEAGSEGSLNLIGSAGIFSVFGDAYFAGNSGIASDTIGNLSFTADAGGVTTLDVSGTLFLNDGTAFGGTSGSMLSVDLTADAEFSLFGATGTEMEILLVDNINNATSGEFLGLSEGALIDIGGGKTGTLSYVGGDGNDISVSVFVAVPEPSSAALLAVGVVGLLARRRRK